MTCEGCHRYSDKMEGEGRILSPDVDDQGDETIEPGFGLGLPGLAAPTLPSRNMVVPPLNFAMVSR